MLTTHTASYFIIATLAVAVGFIFHVPIIVKLMLGIMAGHQLYFGLQSAKLDAKLRVLDRALVVVNQR